MIPYRATAGTAGHHVALSSYTKRWRACVVEFYTGITTSMAPNLTSQDDWTVHALNIHGVFFERRCAAEVIAAPEWSLVSTNYPVEYPPPNGPWRGKESSLDIRARRFLAEGHVLDVQIECKKANPDYVNWVFFGKGGATSPIPFRTAASINAVNEKEAGAWTSTLLMQDGRTDMSIASDAREVRGDYLKHQGSNKTKTSSAAIQDAAYQVAIANRAVVQEDIELLSKARVSAHHPAPPWTRKTYMPVIVTTARLFQASFTVRDVDLNSGEIAFSAVSLTSVTNLVYEYPLPKHLQHSPADPLPALSGFELESFTRMDIIVVQADSLARLLSGLT